MRRRGAVLGLSALLALLAAGFGAFAADPFGAIRAFNAARLKGAGAHVERFGAADGTRHRAWVLGPLSAETPVVLVHGLGASGDYFTGAALALRRAGRTAILPDGPGSGGSDRPRDARGYGLPARVDAVRALVHSLGLEKVDLVGHSLGGFVAARFALEEPPRVRRLVLVDAAGFSEGTAAEVEHVKQTLVPADRAAARSLVDLLFFRKPFPVAGFVVDAFARNYGAENVARTVELVAEEPTLVGRERELPPGTVFVWGEREALFPVDHARRAAGRARKARLLVVTGVGHDGPLEAPKAFDEALAMALR